MLTKSFLYNMVNVLLGSAKGDENGGLFYKN